MKFRNFALCVMHKYICSKNASFVSTLQVKCGEVSRPGFFYRGGKKPTLVASNGSDLFNFSEAVYKFTCDDKCEYHTLELRVEEFNIQKIIVVTDATLLQLRKESLKNSALYGIRTSFLLNCKS